LRDTRLGWPSRIGGVEDANGDPIQDESLFRPPEPRFHTASGLNYMEVGRQSAKRGDPIALPISDAIYPPAAVDFARGND
jgi:hypothetical protein